MGGQTTFPENRGTGSTGCDHNYLDARLESIEKLAGLADLQHARLHDERLAAVERAVKTALAAHERIHEAELRTNLTTDAAISLRLEKLNELRQEVLEDRAQFVRHDVFNTAIEPLREFRSRAVGAAAILTLVSGVIGAAVMRVFS
jgi:hypothetical protein